MVRTPLLLFFVFQTLVLGEDLLSGTQIFETPNGIKAAWETVVYNAADAAMQLLIKETGRKDLSLRDVPLNTLRVFFGRQHHVGVSIDGIQYEVVLGNDQDLQQQAAAALALPASEQVHGASPPSPSPSPSPAQDQAWPSLTSQHWQTQSASSYSHLSLPEITLSGPLEVVVAGGGPVALFTPNAVDVGKVRRVRLAPGATIRVSGHKSVSLRHPVDLPRLPVGYLVEAWAHARTGQAERGFEQAPGVLFLAQQLKAMANNASAPLLSLVVEAASPDTGITINAAHPVVPRAPSKLKVKRDPRDGTVELVPRPGQVATTAESIALELAELSHTWAWPLPHVDLKAFVPYETLLRSILSAQPFELDKVQRKGISVKLTKSEIRGVRLMAFEMEVRSKVQGLAEAAAEIAGEPVEVKEESQLHIFDVVVQVKEKEGAAKGSFNSFTYHPVQVKLKRTYGNTISISKSKLVAMLTGTANETAPLPMGYESEDLGVASRL